MPMDKSTADAYIYAKASGILARSYVGKRSSLLFNTKSLGELWSLVSKKEVPALPEALLARALEKEALQVFIDDYKKLISNYQQPSELLISLIQFYDYDNLKEISAALTLGEKKEIEYADISPFNILNYSAWPDLEKMTAGGPLSWSKTPPELLAQKDNDHRLDLQYIQQIFRSLEKLDSECRNDVKALITENYMMQNVLWALRLRLYYQMTDQEIIELLAYSNEEKNPSDPLACEAVKILSIDPDDYDSWKKWKYASMLNPHEEGAVWSVDPRWITNSFRSYYVKKAYRLFHRFPFSPCPLVCYFILKREELDTIRTASESLRLRINPSEAMVLSGITEAKNG